MADHKQLFVEQRDQRDFAVRKGKSDRTSVVERTQKKAIEKARALNPGKAPFGRACLKHKNGWAQ